MDIITR